MVTPARGLCAPGTAYGRVWRATGRRDRADEERPQNTLHRCTGGMIGSLLRLIRGAAIQVVLDGTEKITRRTTLDSIGVDIASETTLLGKRRRTGRDT